MRRPRALWLTNIPAPYRVALWLALSKHIDLTVCCLAETEPNREWPIPSASEIGCPLHILRSPRVRLGGELVVYLPSPKLLHVLRSTAPDVLLIDGWESPAYVASMAWAKRRHVPVALSYRSARGAHTYASGPVAKLRSAVFRAADMIYAAGPETVEVVSAMGVPDERIVCGTNTVDVDDVRRRVAAARATVTPGSAHTFLYVGQLIPRKNVSAALTAFGQARAADDRFVVVGDGPDRPSLELQAARLGISAHVQFTGSLAPDEVAGCYALANTLVLPSTKEVWGLVVNEALAAGLHVVVSDRTGVAAAVADMPGVLVCEPNEPALTEALVASRESWRGYIADPPILRATPDAAAKQLAELVAAVMAST